MTLQIPIFVSHSLRQPFRGTKSKGRVGDPPSHSPRRRAVLGSLVWQDSYWIWRGGEHCLSKACRVEPERDLIWRVYVKLG